MIIFFSQKLKPHLTPTILSFYSLKLAALLSKIFQSFLSNGFWCKNTHFQQTQNWGSSWHIIKTILIYKDTVEEVISNEGHFPDQYNCYDEHGLFFGPVFHATDRTASLVMRSPDLVVGSSSDEEEWNIGN